MVKVKRIVFINFLLLPILVFAQYPNPYQSAFEWEQRLAEQYQQQNQTAYNMGCAMGLVLSGQQLIADGQYLDGVLKFEDAWSEYDYLPALECLGVCYEVGIGVDRDTDMADLYYEEGANHNEPNCRAAIQRINRYGHYTSSHRNKIISNLQAKFNAGSGYAAPSYNGTYDSGNSSSGSSSIYSKCRICGGSGTCTSCHGRGGEWRDTGYYTGSGNKSWIDCPSCHGNKRCFNCHGTGRQ